MTAHRTAELDRLPVCESAKRRPPKTPARAEAGGNKWHSCKPLPKEFRKDWFNYRQIMRDGNTAIYEQTWNGSPNPSISYEVIRIRCRESFQISGRFVQAAEVYRTRKPGGSMAGRCGIKSPHFANCERSWSR
jgi:hypothetical protein